VSNPRASNPWVRLVTSRCGCSTEAMLAGTCAPWPGDGCRSVPGGSGARAFALDVLKRTKTEGTIGELLGYSPQAAAEKLIAGDIDAAFIVTGWDSPAVQALINAKGVELASFPRADAMVALYRGRVKT